MDLVVITVLLSISLSACYQDAIPDPDFIQSIEEDKTPSFQKQEPTVPGYFKFLCKKVAQLELVSEEERELLKNVENIDPQTITETLLDIMSRTPTQQSQCTIDIGMIVSQIAELTILVPVCYILLIFILICTVRKSRVLLLSSHIIAVYTAAVYFKLNQQYSEIKAKKISALLDIPSHCREQLTISDLLSAVFSKSWSKVQIGDPCQKYHYQAVSEPIYELNFMKCLVYPLFSLITVPIQVVGEELGVFFENVLSPFPIHLQIPILAFMLFLPPLCLFALRLTWTSSKDTHQNSNNTEVTGMKNEVLLQLRHLEQEILTIKHHTKPITDVSDIARICDQGIVYGEVNDVATITKETL